MKIKIGKYTLENDVEVKVIPDGYEIFASSVEEHEIAPSDFDSAEFGSNGSIIVYRE